jgi:hypothetical protein
MSHSEDRRRILERRERFLRASLYGVTTGVLVTACDPSGAACHSARRNLPRAVVKTVGCDAPLVCLTVDVARPPVSPSAVPADASTDADADPETET